MSVEVQAGHGEIGSGIGRLLLEADHAVLLVEFHHTVALGIADVVGVDHGSVDVGVVPQDAAETPAVKDVVAQHEGHLVVADEFFAEDESLGEPIGHLLLDEAEAAAPLAAVTEQALEARQVVRGGDDQDVPDPADHQRVDKG